jgi:hypothetical protein
MKRYVIVYHNKTADTVDHFETFAASLNEAVLRLRMKRFKFKILEMTVS